jgi:hypothetical protein
VDNPAAFAGGSRFVKSTRCYFLNTIQIANGIGTATIEINIRAKKAPRKSVIKFFFLVF